MAKSSSSLFFFFFLSLLLLFHYLSLICREAKITEKPDKNNVIPFFIFGDSILDTGNNNYINTTTLEQANFWPYGETYFSFPTGRFSDGRMLPDFFAEYAHLPFIPPFLQPGSDYYFGSNFASAGAGVLFETSQKDAIDLTTQLGFYKKVEIWLRQKLGNDEAKMKISKAVYLFNIGTDDYAIPFLFNSSLFKSYSNSEYVSFVIGNLTTVIEEVYKVGGRKFAFINLQELGCLPGLRIIKPENNGTCFEEITKLATLHNKALSELLFNLEKQLKGFKYALFDIYNGIQQRMKHPSKYGLKEGERACCGTGPYRGIDSCGGRRPVKEFESCKNPNEYLFWDCFHPTEKAFKQLADEMWSGHSNSSSPISIGPYNLNQLFHM